MYEDTFVASLPRSQFLADIEAVADFLTKRILTANRSYQTSTDIGEKVDILLCLITYQSILSLLNTAYVAEDGKMLDAAKDVFRNLPDYQSCTTDFSNQQVDIYIDRITESLQASLALQVTMLSHLTENNSFTTIANQIHSGTY